MREGIRNTRLTIAICLVACCILGTLAARARGVDESGRNETESLKNFLRGYVENLQLGNTPTQYFAAFVDLKGDGVRDAIVYFTGQHLCGTGGCATLVLVPGGPSFKIVTQITIAWPPIRVLETKTNGWHDLGIWVQGGGIQPGYEAKLSFDGKTYLRNPSRPPSRRLAEKAPGKIVVPQNPKGQLL